MNQQVFLLKMGMQIFILNRQGEATSGDVVVSYTGNSEGAGSVTLEVTDVEGQKDDATAVVNVQAELTEFRITSNFTSNTTWEDVRPMSWGGRIIVESGNTLTIEGCADHKGGSVDSEPPF